MASFAGILSGGVRGFRDGYNDNKNKQHDKEMLLLRQQVTSDYENRIHERNRGEKKTDDAAAREITVADREDERDWKSKEADKVRKADLKKESKKGQNIKTITEMVDGVEQKSLVRINDDGTYTKLREEGMDSSAPNMTWDDARSKAKSLYDEKASIWSKDKTQFGMDEEAIIDTWTNEILANGRPVTGIAGAGKPQGMLNNSEKAPVDSVKKQGSNKPSIGDVVKVPAGTPDNTYTSNGVTVKVVNGVATVIEVN